MSGDLGPLRRVVAEGVNEHGVQTETLDCGHVIHRKQDAFGHTNAYRRRCRHCRVVPTCPRCGKNEDTVPATNYGRPTGGWQHRCCGITTWPTDTTAAKAPQGGRR